MNQSVQIFDVAPRGKARVYAGGIFLGLGVLFLLYWLLNPGQWAAASTTGRLAILLLAGVAIILGSYILFINHSVMIDPVGRQVTVSAFFLRTRIQRTAQPFADFQRIEVRRGGYEDSDAHYCQVGLKRSVGRVVWLRVFKAPATGISTETLAFVTELAQLTGLRYDEVPD